MWDDQKRKRFDELSEPGRQLNAVEQAELAALVQELEEAESAYLAPVNERLRRENDLTEKENEQLAKLVQRKEALARRIRIVLTEAQLERQAIDSELATVLAESRGSDTED